jgi:PEP-CTERM motif
MKKLALLTTLLALLSTFAMADAISFGFIDDKNTPPVQINATGVDLTSGRLLAVRDTTTNTTYFINGTADVFTGPASSYIASGGVLVAQFNPGSGLEVDANSSACVGGSKPGVCLQGILNTTGTYVATLGGTGSFQGLFLVTYVSPYITSLFGDANVWLPTGSDAFTTSNNLFVNGGQTDVATLGAGAITFQTPVPEPATLGMVGSGVLACAFGARRFLRI